MIKFAFEALLIDLFPESASHLVVDFIDRSANCVAFVWAYQSFVHMATIIAKKLPDIRVAPGVFVCRVCGGIRVLAGGESPQG